MGPNFDIKWSKLTIFRPNNQEIWPLEGYLSSKIGGGPFFPSKWPKIAIPRGSPGKMRKMVPMRGKIRGVFAVFSGKIDDFGGPEGGVRFDDRYTCHQRGTSIALRAGDICAFG